MKHIKKFNSFKINELKSNDINISYITSKMEELKDIVSTQSENLLEYSFDSKIDIFDEDDVNLETSIESESEDILKINLYLTEEEIIYEIDLENLKLTKIENEEEVQYEHNLLDIDEGLDIIEKEIYQYLGVSEKLK